MHPKDATGSSVVLHDHSPDATGLSRGTSRSQLTKHLSPRLPDAMGLSHGVSRFELDSCERESPRHKAVASSPIIAGLRSSKPEDSTGQARGISFRKDSTGQARGISFRLCAQPKKQKKASPAARR